MERQRLAKIAELQAQMKKKKTGGGSQTRTAARGSATEKGEKEKKIVGKPDVGQKK